MGGQQVHSLSAQGAAGKHSGKSLAYGNIGREIARICQALGAQVLATKRDLKTLDAGGYVLEGMGDLQADIPERLYPPQALPSMALRVRFPGPYRPAHTRNAGFGKRKGV